tara:strand:- start:39 stop:491 length:453 start_codon:yes stop_codon:yes gene_type:complete
MSDTELKNKMVKIIDTCNTLAKDYATKHDELTDVFNAFKLAINKLKNTNDQRAAGSETIINELLEIIQNKGGHLLTDEHISKIQSWKDEQKRLMTNFIQEAESISAIVDGLEDITTNSRNRLNSQQLGGKRKRNTIKKNNKNKKTLKKRK